ncbi:MAG TPA: PEGA domain-containing protein [Chloroflexota bacterium]|nr:PEGA domain-containing protein [Chloroflexota bacterium]
MEFPFEAEFEPPTLADLKRGLRAVWSWRGLAGLAIAAGLGYGAYRLDRHFAARAPEGVGTVSVATTPLPAFLFIDGRPRGETPAAVVLPAGQHALQLSAAGYTSVRASIEIHAGETTDVARELWPGHVQVLPVAAPLPGSRVDSTSFEDDGSIALDVELSSDAHQLWLLDGGGSYRRFGPTAQGSVALTSDRQELAFAGARSVDALSFQTRNAVWMTDGSNPPSLLYVLPQDQTTAQFSSVSWAPQARLLLAVAANPGSTGGAQSRLLLLSPDKGLERDIIDLPAAVVDGSFTWSPNGQQVAFVARSGSATSLCLLDLNTGQFRRLADVGGTSDPLPVAEIAWRPDGQVVFSAEAPGQNAVGLWGFGGTPSAMLYAAAAAGGPVTALSKALLRGPQVLSDGTILGFGPAKGGGVALEELGPGGSAEFLDGTGLNQQRFAARWDVAHRQALLVAAASSGSGDPPRLWRLQFVPGDPQ